MCSKNELNILLKKLADIYREVYGEDIVRIVLYGSYARGTYDQYSDVDIVAIVNGDRAVLQKKLKSVWDKSADLELEYEFCPRLLFRGMNTRSTDTIYHIIEILSVRGST